MMKDLNPNTDVVVHPQVTAGVIDLGVPHEELAKGNVVLLLNAVAVIARDYLVVGVAVVNDAGHLRRGAGGLGSGRGAARRGGCGAGDVDADVVVEPEVSALCWDKSEQGASMCLPSRARIHTIVDLWVPFLELVVANAVLLLDHVTLVARGDLMELVTVVGQAGHGRRMACRRLGGGARRQGGAGRCGGASGRGDRADHTVVLAGVKVGALGIGVQRLELIDSEAPGLAKALTGVTRASSHREATANISAQRQLRRGEELGEETQSKEVVQLHRETRLFEVDVEEKTGVLDVSDATRNGLSQGQDHVLL